MKRIASVVSALFLGAVSLRAQTDPTIGSRLSYALASMQAEDSVVVWVFLKDKGPDSLTRTYTTSVVSSRSIARRLKVRDLAHVVDSTDWPVYSAYVAEVASLGRVRHASKWFNAVSVFTTKEGIEAIAQLPFVARLERIAQFETQSASGIRGVESYSRLPQAISAPRYDYGPSLEQVKQLNVPMLHAKGNTGQGVLIALMDAGFPRLDHEAFKSMKIIATYDFVENKVDVTPSDSSGGHGTMTLSTIGGFVPGKLIGPAFGATYVLARTEVEATETPAEEDNWVAAAEWADSIGVDITSTSLGYLAFDDPYKDWTWEDMDGNTTLITRAADMAVSKGIVVVNSAGNNPNFESDIFGPMKDSLGNLIPINHNTLGAPADGDSVLTAGAVDSTGKRAFFSSVGPTTGKTPRIKPDVMAMGVSVYVASPSKTDAYGRVDGTSFSCPLTAGVVALLLHDVPGATPMQIIRALRASGNNAGAPNNLYGWGVPNAPIAIKFLKKP